MMDCTKRDIVNRKKQVIFIAMMKYCRTCNRMTSHEKKHGVWVCTNHK